MVRARPRCAVPANWLTKVVSTAGGYPRAAFTADSGGCSLKRRATRAQDACSWARGPVISQGIQGPTTATTPGRIEREAQPREQQDTHAVRRHAEMRGGGKHGEGAGAARARAAETFGTVQPACDSDRSASAWQSNTATTYGCQSRRVGTVWFRRSAGPDRLAAAATEPGE